MIELKNSKEISGLNQDLIVNIGNYDGVHRGHAELIKYLKSEADQKNCKLCLYTFNPHPRIHFEAIDNFLLTSNQDKKKNLANLGVDYLLELNFLEISKLSAEDFLKTYIQPISNIKSLYLGYDFRFGKDKKGDFILANNVLKDNLIELNKSPEFKFGDMTPSSSRIRDHLIMGEIIHANELLSRPYSLAGSVVKGLGKGKQIGIPTINLDIPIEFLVPKKGVYFTKIFIKDREYNSITNIGINPTFGKLNKTSIETHAFEFDEDVYGTEVKLEFYLYHRSEKKFNDVSELVNQIKSDIHLAKKFWS